MIRSQRNRARLRLVVGWLLSPVLLAVLLWVLWFLGRMAFSGSEWVADHQFRTWGQRWLFPDGFDLTQATAPGYLLLLTWLLVGYVVLFWSDAYDGPGALTTTGVVLAVLVGGVQVVRGIND